MANKEFLEPLLSDFVLPIPMTWRMVLLEPLIEEKHKDSMLEKAERTKDIERHNSVISMVLSMGPLCYVHPKFLGTEVFPEVGDFVLHSAVAGTKNLYAMKQKSKIARIAGQDEELNSVRIRIISDEEVIAIVKEPNLLSYKV